MADRRPRGARRLPPDRTRAGRDLEADVGLSARRARFARRAPSCAHATAVYLGAIAVVTAALARRRRSPTPGRRRGAVRCSSWPRCCSLLPASELAIALVQRSSRRSSRRAAAAARSRRRAGRARTMVVVPTLLTSVDGRRRAARAPRGAGARQPRSAHPFRDPQRLRRRRTRARQPDDDAILDAARAGIEALNAALGPEHGRPLLPVPSRTRSGTRASRCGWDGSASAARSRSSTVCCAAPPTPASSCRSASSPSCPSIRYCITLDSDTRLPRDAAQRADRHHRAPAQPAAFRSARSAASPKATASCSRASA